MVTAIANVTIAINDVNDNPPFWPKEIYEVSVAEDEPEGSAILTLLAEDKDAEAR